MALSHLIFSALLIWNLMVTFFHTNNMKTLKIPMKKISNIFMSSINAWFKIHISYFLALGFWPNSLLVFRPIVLIEFIKFRGISGWWFNENFKNDISWKDFSIGIIIGNCGEDQMQRKWLIYFLFFGNFKIPTLKICQSTHLARELISNIKKR